MQEIFAEHQRKLREELERACRPLDRLLPRRDEEDPEGGAAGARFLPPAMVAKTVVHPAGGQSTSADLGKQTAGGPEDSSEGYLKRIAELEEALRRAKARGKRPEEVQVSAAKRRTQANRAAAFVAAFPEPAEGESFDAERFLELKEHVAVVQQQCDEARSQLLALKLAWEEEHHKHEAEVKSLMADLVKVRASTEEQSTSAQTKELGRLMRRMDSAAERANRSVRVADLERALSDQTRQHEEELQQLRRASNVEQANLLVELRTACRYVYQMAAVAQQAGAATPPFYGRMQIFLDTNAVNPQPLPILRPVQAAPAVPAPAAALPAAADDDGGGVEDEP